MDTKLKKYRPLAAWLSFFLGCSIIILFLIISFAAFVNSNGNAEALKANLHGDYKNTIAFKERTGMYFRDLLDVALASNDKDYTEIIKEGLDREGDNLLYYVSNQDTGLDMNNISTDKLFTDSGTLMSLPADYKYYWYFNGQRISVIDHGQPVDVKRLDSGYHGNIPQMDTLTQAPAELNNIRAVVAVRDTLKENPYAHSRYYEESQILSIFGQVYIILGVLGIVLLIYAIIRHRDKHEFDRKLASWSGRFWLEVKIVLSCLIFYQLTLLIVDSSWYWFNPLNGITGFIFLNFAILLGYWWFYLMLIDLFINRRKFFTHNSINALFRWHRKYENKYSRQQSMLKKAYMLVVVEGVLALFSVFFLLIYILIYNVLALLIALLIAGTGIYIIYRYLRQYNQTINDLGKLIDHIKMIKNGDMSTKLELAADAEMYPAACNLNAIQEGMSISVAEKIKSERMKIELITNVSHDLKTPLTSIVSYVDLLKKEEGLPEHVNDYINILSQKSERLKNLIQDLFDLSKANSDNIALDMEIIDLARLIRQTVADMEEPINDSGLVFRLNLPEEPVYIRSDGKKLYRVWENLISNSLKYSLTGSRVFIDLVLDDKAALATIKNTSNYEMNFTEDEILQRFVRGDESRSTEGSGLGLSIAQSFTEICGGEFSITMDGDLFKVELRFDTV